MRRWGTRLLWAWAVVLAALLLLPLADVSATRFVPMLQALWWLWVLAAMPTLLVAAALRRWPAAALVLVGLVVPAIPILTTGSPGASGDARRTLTVMSSNLKVSLGDPDRIVGAVRAHHADVLVLAEVDAHYLDRLRSRGLADTLPYGWDAAVAGSNAGTVVLSRFPLRPDARYPDGHHYTFQTPIVDLDVDGVDVVFRGVHTFAPTPGPASRWRGDLRALAEWARRVPRSQSLVLAGDFNSGRVHPGLRDLASGFAVAPSGPAALTWPSGGRSPSFVDIDHVLARGWTPTASGSLAVDGSDHRAVWAQLARP